MADILVRLPFDSLEGGDAGEAEDDAAPRAVPPTEAPEAGSSAREAGTVHCEYGTIVWLEGQGG